MLVFTVVMQRDRPGLELRSMWSRGRRVHFSAGPQRSASHAVTAGSQSRFFICSYSVPQTDLSPSASAKATLSQLSFLPYAAHFPPPHATPKKNFRYHSGHRRTTKIVAACLLGGFSATRVPGKGVAEATSTRGTCRRERLDRSQLPGWRQDGVSAEARGVEAGWWWRGRVWVVNQGATPQCRGPVNLVNEEWASGQMIHPQSSINTAARGRQGHCYRWPRSPGSTGFRTIFGPAQLLLNGETWPAESRGGLTLAALPVTANREGKQGRRPNIYAHRTQFTYQQPE